MVHCVSLLLSLGYKVRAKVWSSYSSREGLRSVYLITILLTWIRLIIIQRKQRRDCGMRMDVFKNNGSSLVTSRQPEPKAANLLGVVMLVWQYW